MFGFISRLFVLLSLAITASASRTSNGNPQQAISVDFNGPLPTNVTWDEHSLFINGKRLLVYSGEFHPFRLPVPSLWLDVLQKIRSLGFSAVSFYVDWALVEGSPGEVRLDGVFALEPFFEAAQKAGIYLIARPGPYINAEVSGGGFPGWLQRIKGHVRTADADFLDATELYIKTVCEVIAKAQITNGGPIILVQPENEYSHWAEGFENDATYFRYVKKQFRDAGIVVPLITNDAGADGNNAPGSAASYDIYGHDGYPLGFDCSNPDIWPKGRLPTDWARLHQEQSPSTPYTIPEFQGGSFDPWGGPGFDKCLSLTNAEFERVFWKNLYSFGVTIYNVYMIYGGTNWGNMGYPNGYTSYDYSAPISEDRLVSREKYSEAKLQANFLATSPAYLTAVPGSPQAGAYVSTKELTVTELKSGKTKFLVVRHTDYTSRNTTNYKLALNSTRAGLLTIPQASDTLSLHGRDSKIHVVDYDLFGINLLYSTAEILTVKQYGDERVLVVYGGANEQHELAVDMVSEHIRLPGQGLQVLEVGNYTVVNWKATSQYIAIRIGCLNIWIVDRKSAYDFWVLDVTDTASGNTPYVGTATSSIIIKGAYLLRTAYATEHELRITGDLNATSTIQVIAGAPKALRALSFNGEHIDFTQDERGVVIAKLVYTVPQLHIPDLEKQKWFYIDSLPEVQVSYSDAAWVQADIRSSNNTYRKLSTPRSLYSSDYGYHAGTLLYHGHFNATGREKNITIEAQGGQSFGFSVWLGDHFLGSFIGDKNDEARSLTFRLPKLKRQHYVLTVVIDNLGYDENWIVGKDDMKSPRGILDYALDGHAQEDIAWRLTGNFGGECYIDKDRGPLNEGGMWAERHGYHLPLGPSLDDLRMNTWTTRSPMEGILKPGIGWFITTFDLDMPKGYDIPLAIELPDIRKTHVSSAEGRAKASGTYRLQIFVNGWQFGKYVHHLGPQTKYPVPEGIWNYHGQNLVAISLWAMEEGGAKIDGIKLAVGSIIQSGYSGIETVTALPWSYRQGVY